MSDQGHALCRNHTDVIRQQSSWLVRQHLHVKRQVSVQHQDTEVTDPCSNKRSSKTSLSLAQYFNEPLTALVPSMC